MKKRELLADLVVIVATYPRRAKDDCGWGKAVATALLEQ
jgi:hypothetical protein